MSISVEYSVSNDFSEGSRIINGIHRRICILKPVSVLVDHFEVVIVFGNVF